MIHIKKYNTLSNTLKSIDSDIIVMWYNNNNPTTPDITKKRYLLLKFIVNLTMLY